MIWQGLSQNRRHFAVAQIQKVTQKSRQSIQVGLSIKGRSSD